MPEFTALIAAFGPTGAIIALAVMAMRSIWPWLRDQYLARQVNALDKLVAYMERSETRMVAMETNQAVVVGMLGEMQQDLAVICAGLQIDQPSRPRRQPSVRATAGVR